MLKKAHKKKLTPKRIQKGTVGNFFVFGILALLAVLALIAVGGLPSDTFPNSGQVVNAVPPSTMPTHSNLQLETFGYVTIAPTPTAGAALCQQGGVNNEASILDGYSPGSGQTVSQTGQIKVWVSDERPPFVAPGQQINTSTGAVTSVGTTSAKAPDNYLWEPALYIAPNTAESGGTPFFPTIVKGTVDNNPPTGGGSGGINSVAPDPFPAGVTNADPGFNQYTAEYIWNVSALGLAAGSYQAEFVIHDGDVNRGIGCVSIKIQ